MSTPRKEYFLAERGHELGAEFVMGVGGAVDVIAGLTRRAPAHLAAARPRVAVPAAAGAAAHVPPLRRHEHAVRVDGGARARRPARAALTRHWPAKVSDAGRLSS